MASRGFIELLRMADLAESRKTGRHSKDQAQWVGVAFVVAGQRLVAPMGEISEVLAMPSAITPVPMSQPWLIGVANIRGRLLPLTDLAQFVDKPTQKQLVTQKKVIVIDQSEIFSGLQVDQVLGIQQFNISQYVPEPMPSDSAFAPYNHGKFVKDGGEEWFVFMPSLLVNDERFLEAAV